MNMSSSEHSKAPVASNSGLSSNQKMIRKWTRPTLPWYQKLNYSLILGIVVAVGLNGAFLIWFLRQPLPPMMYQLADGMDGLFKPTPSPCPPFESTSILDGKGKVIEKQYVVPTYIVPANRLPFPKEKEKEQDFTAK